MNVSDIMNRSRIGIESSASLVQAAIEMDRNAVGWLPVFDDGKVIGTIAERDIVVRCVARAKNPVEVPVSAVMTPHLICCGEDDDVRKAADLMREYRCERLLVLNPERWLSGFVTVKDLAAAGEDHLVAEVTAEQDAEV